VKIELSTDGGATHRVVLATSTVYDGSHPVLVQAGWATASARVRLTWTDSGAVGDISDQSYRIQ
jgi:hypothetical protein